MPRLLCPHCTIVHSPLCPQPRRWPLTDLLTAMARRGSTNPATDLGTGGEAWTRAQLHGLTDATADRWAIKAGFHPAQVWPGWVDAGLSVVDRQRIEGGWRHAWLHHEPDPIPSTKKERNVA